MCVYGALLLFQFRTHADVWGVPGKKAPKRRIKVANRDVSDGLAQFNTNVSYTVGGVMSQAKPMHESDGNEGPEQPQLSVWVMLAFLIIVTVLMGFCTQFAIDSSDALSQKANISKPFIGLILLPINNDLTPIEHAVEDNMKQTMNFTIGKCLQTSLFVTPVMVIVAWGMGLDLSLYFDGFEVVSLLLRCSFSII